VSFLHRKLSLLGQAHILSQSTDLIFLALQVILALGNRPKAEKLTYAISFLVFAFFSLYLIFMTVILTIKAFCVSSSLQAQP